MIEQLEAEAKYFDLRGTAALDNNIAGLASLLFSRGINPDNEVPVAYELHTEEAFFHMSVLLSNIRVIGAGLEGIDEFIRKNPGSPLPVRRVAIDDVTQREFDEAVKRIEVVVLAVDLPKGLEVDVTED